LTAEVLGFHTAYDRLRETIFGCNAAHPDIRKERRSLTVEGSPSGEPLRLDLYRPADLAGSAFASPVGVVASLGMFAHSTDDTRFNRFCRCLARCGFWVFAPHHPDLSTYRYAPAAVQRIIAAFSHSERLLQKTDDPAARKTTTGGRVGLLGLCFGGSASLLAAADPTISDRVAFVATFGAPARYRDLVRYAVCGEHGFDKKTQSERPNAQWALVALCNLAAPLGLASDRDTLSQYTRAVMCGQAKAAAAAWDALSLRAQAMLSVLATDDRGAKRRLAERATAAIPQHYRAPADVAAAGKIRCPVFLFHGRKDRLVPHTQAHVLHAALAHHTRVHRCVSTAGGHTRSARISSAKDIPVLFSTLTDTIALWRFFYDLMTVAAVCHKANSI
jgi:dienelactone hydrolase